MFIAVILTLLLSCVTTKTIIEYETVLTEQDIPEFPELNYYEESENGELITVDSFWFQKVAEYKLKMEDLRTVLHLIEYRERNKK